MTDDEFFTFLQAGVSRQTSCEQGADRGRLQGRPSRAGRAPAPSSRAC